MSKECTRLVESLELDDFLGVSSIASAVHDLQMRMGVVKSMVMASDSPQVIVSFEVEGQLETRSTEVSPPPHRSLARSRCAR